MIGKNDQIEFLNIIEQFSLTWLAHNLSNLKSVAFLWNMYSLIEVFGEAVTVTDTRALFSMYDPMMIMGVNLSHKIAE